MRISLASLVALSRICCACSVAADVYKRQWYTRPHRLIFSYLYSPLLLLSKCSFCIILNFVCQNRAITFVITLCGRSLQAIRAPFIGIPHTETSRLFLASSSACLTICSGAIAVCFFIPSIPWPARRKNSVSDGPGPVSYTHLDVYKRQSMNCRIISSNSSGLRSPSV